MNNYLPAKLQKKKKIKVYTQEINKQYVQKETAAKHYCIIVTYYYLVLTEKTVKSIFNNALVFN